MYVPQGDLLVKPFHHGSTDKTTPLCYQTARFHHPNLRVGMLPPCHAEAMFFWNNISIALWSDGDTSGN